MNKNIIDKMEDYFCAADIRALHDNYESRVREVVLDDHELHSHLKVINFERVYDSILCSALPNIMDAAGIGLTISDYRFFGFGLGTGLVFEGIRLVLRKFSKRDIRESIGRIERVITEWDSRNNPSGHIRNYNEGEEWKSK
jgi:hypothetical protein